MTAHYDIDRADFECWLEEQDRVMATSDICFCPIADYLKIALEDEGVSVMNELVGGVDTGRAFFTTSNYRSVIDRHPLPDWANKFSHLEMEADGPTLAAALRRIK